MNIIGSNSIVLNEIYSTNEYASNLLSHSKQIDGTIVLTDFQTNGKGQANNVWVSEKGKNLLLSIILYPNFLELDKQFYLSMSISLGILHTIRKFTDSLIEVKWPNDILISQKKVSGVLIKNTISGKKIKNSIIGIGINVNQKEFGHLSKTATSLCIEEKKELDLKIVVEELKKNLNRYYNKLRFLQYDEIKAEYEQNLFRNGINSEFEIPVPGSLENKMISGKILGVDKLGKLRVLINGDVVTFMHKEIIFK